MFGYGFLAVVLVLYLGAIGFDGAEVGLLLGADAARRRRDLAPADDARRPVRPQADAVPRVAADGRRRDRVRRQHRVPRAARRRDAGRAQPERQRGRAVPRHRAGLALAARRRTRPDLAVRALPGRRVGRDGVRVARRGRRHAGGPRRRVRAGGLVPGRDHRLRHRRRGDGVRVPAALAGRRGPGRGDGPGRRPPDDPPGAAQVAGDRGPAVGAVRARRVRRRVRHPGVHRLLADRAVRGRSRPGRRDPVRAPTSWPRCRRSPRGRWRPGSG